MFSEHRQSLRKPAVAGQFYPADPSRLTQQLEQLIDRAADIPHGRIKAIVVPHAGYVYSGPVAATGYRALRQQAPSITRVVLLGPSHHVGFRGVATCSAEYYRTPLGDIALDRGAVTAIAGLPQVCELDEAHEHEHCLEVQLPFLQLLLDEFSLLPLVVGDCPSPQVAEVLDRLWGGDETLIVVSSDLSHYHPYDEARVQDQRTSDAILQLQPGQIQYQDACGRNPVNGLLLAARQKHLNPSLADLRNSGDTAGSKDRVVGYGTYLFSQND